jgi:hypothetical protein
MSDSLTKSVSFLTQFTSRFTVGIKTKELSNYIKEILKTKAANIQRFSIATDESTISNTA